MTEVEAEKWRNESLEIESRIAEIRVILRAFDLLATDEPEFDAYETIWG